MTRLGVVADSHGRDLWLERYLKLCKQEMYDAVFHMGDHDSDARWLERRLDVPVYYVAGNCDMFSGSPRMVEAAYGCHRILAVHGHLQDVKYGYDRLSYFAEERRDTIALFGHTHRPCVDWVGGVLLVNPGALMDGRYAELTLEGDRAVPVLKSFRD